MTSTDQHARTSDTLNSPAIPHTRHNQRMETDSGFVVGLLGPQELSAQLKRSIFKGSALFKSKPKERLEDNKAI